MNSNAKTKLLLHSPTLFVFPLILFLIFSNLTSCKEKAAGLAPVDSLINNGMYNQATELLREYARKDYSDSLQYDRIQYRFEKIQQKLFFAGLDSMIRLKRWQRSDSLLERIQLSLKDSAKQIQKKYYFELYHKKSQVDSALKRDTPYWNDIRNGLKYTFEDANLVRVKYELLALHLAENDSLLKARILFDKSFRMVRFNQLNDNLKQAYLNFMDGKFNSCLLILKQIPEDQKDKHWKKLEHFLTLYANKLTIEERFKLW